MLKHTILKSVNFSTLPQHCIKIQKIDEVISIEMNRQATLRLYKDILFCAKRFPSIKRAKIVAEIRADFRAAKNVTDEKELKKLQATAIDGLGKLSMYTNLPKRSSNWDVYMDRQPMPNMNN